MEAGVSTRYLTVHDVAAMLQLAPKTVRAKTRRGEIPGFKAGDGVTCQYRYDPVQIELLIAKWKRGSRGGAA